MIEMQLLKYSNRLDNLYKKAQIYDSDIEMLSEWAKYLCVLTSAYLEQCIRAIFADYVSKKAHPSISKFAQHHIKNFQNPKMEKIYQLVGCFDTAWLENLKINTEGELKDSIDSIVANRNNIAHGRDVGLTFANLQKYYAAVQSVLKIVKNQIPSN